MRKLLLLFLLVPLGGEAAGPIARLVWTNPVSYVDGRPLPISDLKEIVVSWGRTSAGPFDAGSVTVAAPATTVDVPGLVCGNYHFVARAVVKTNEASVNTTAVIYATGVSCNTPNPPTAVTAQ